MASKFASSAGRRATCAHLWQRSLGFSSSSAVVEPATSAAGASAAAVKPEEVRKKWGLSVLVLILPCAATFGLGTWQLFRREDKIELLKFRRSRFDEDPIALEEAIAITRPDGDKLQSSTSSDLLQYRKVYCEGVFDETKSLFVGPRSRTLYGAAQKGYYIVSPLMCRSKIDGSIPQRVTDIWGQLGGRRQLPVLVNRGWVPASIRNAALAHEQPLPTVNGLPEKSKEPKHDSRWMRWGKLQVAVQEDSVKEDTVRVSGVIRDGEQPNMFVPNNQPEIGQWFYVDIPAMAQNMGLPNNVTYMEAVSNPLDGEGRNKFPLPKESDAFLKSSVMPQDHLNYALTWYSLSAATTFMAVKRLQSLKRGR